MPISILDAWRKLVGTGPEAPALIEAAEARVWSRRELDELGAAWVREARQPLAGRLVFFAEPNGVAWLRVFIGLLRAGAVAAPLDPSGPPESRLAVAEKLGASYLWSAGQLLPIGSGKRAYRDGRRVVKLTSGSSGEPRALPFTDAQMLADGRQICVTMGIRPIDLNLGLIPFGHSYGLGNLVVPLVAQGTAIVCAPSALPHVLAGTVERWRANVFPAVPAVLRALAESKVAPARIRSLRTVISAGSPLPADLARAFQTRFGLKIHNFYGSSETGGIAYDRTGNAALDGRGVGKPLRGVRLVFGRGPRFQVTSPAVFTLGNRQRDGSEGIHRPADLAQLGSDGILRLLGRTGRWVKIGGRRLNPTEVEQAIKSLTGVRDALVTLHPNRPEVLAAAVAGGIPAESVRELLAGKLASWKVPRKLLVIPQFPLTPRGKTDFSRLRELLGRVPRNANEGGPSPANR